MCNCSDTPFHQQPNIGTPRPGLSDPKFFELWNQIAQEHHSSRREPLMEQRIELLAREQA